MPDHDKLILFDCKREILLSMAENIERATPARPFIAAGEAIADDSGALVLVPPRGPEGSVATH